MVCFVVLPFLLLFLLLSHTCRFEGASVHCECILAVYLNLFWCSTFLLPSSSFRLPCVCVCVCERFVHKKKRITLQKQHNHDKVPLHQLTSSAIGNIPEGNLDGVKRGILRQVMHADEHLFEFKVSATLEPTHVNVYLQSKVAVEVERGQGGLGA